MKMKRTKKLFGEHGQGLIEYLAIVALVAVGSIAVIRVLGQNISVRFGNIANVLQNKEQSISYDRVEETMVRKKNLNNFFKGTASKANTSSADED